MDKVCVRMLLLIIIYTFHTQTAAVLVTSSSNWSNLFSVFGNDKPLQHVSHGVCA